VHRLLQSLPEIPAEGRADAAQQFLARCQDDLAAEDRAEIERSVCDLLDDRRFADLFALGSRAEVPIAGRLVYADGRPLPVSGQIDRLVVTDDEVLIADYKTNRSTNRPAPQNLQEALATHAPYVAQLALYRAVIGRIYPEKTVRAALVWTDVPELMEIPAAALDAELTRLRGGSQAA
jgi:ATP-dependent helicase/nuclease subunit A